MKKILLSLTVVGMLLSCKESADTKATTESAQAVAETAEQPTNKYTVTPFEPSQEFKGAEITSMTYKEGTFDFGVANYELGSQTPDAESKMCANSGKGQHIHLIVDNAPYAAKYESSFDYDLPDGEHYLTAFLSRSYHESIKTDAASVVKKITVANNSITSEEEISGPVLSYSRPKGTYVGKDTEKVMLDFYLANVELGDMKVKATINGEEHLIDKWQPYYIEGMPMGNNTITLALVDADGNTVDAPLTPVTREFTLKADPETKMDSK